MSQADYTIADQDGASFLPDINGQLAAIVSNNSGATEPTTTYAYMLWADTSSGILKQRNSANNAWISVLTLSTGAVIAIPNDIVTTAKILNANVTTDKIADDAVTNAKLAFDGGALGFRNKIIGGDFTTNPWQRGTSFAPITPGTYAADRFQYGASGAADISTLKTVDSPTASQAGIFTQHCLHLDVTTAVAAIAATDYSIVYQRIEGLNAASFGFGQAGTRYATLSFWHKHTKTGIYCAAFRNGDGTRSYVAEYTQDVTDTWEKATITIPIDTTGTWIYDSTGSGLDVSFALAAGTTYQTTANTWTAGNFLATANQVNALDNIANNFKIALVQLEAGSIATPFETRDVGTELALCHRYYEICPVSFRSNIGGSTFAEVPIIFKVKKRASPTYTLTGAIASTNITSDTIRVNDSAPTEGVGYTITATAVNTDTYIFHRIVLAQAEL
jgi:hypothetical protein